MPSTTAPDLIERVAGEEKAGVCGGKVCAEFEDDLPYVGKPLGEGVDGLGEELFPAGALLDEGAFGVARELEQEGSDLRLFCLEVEGGHAGEPAEHLCGGCVRGPAPAGGDGVEEGREVVADEELLCVGGEGIVENKEPGGAVDNRTATGRGTVPFARCCFHWRRWHCSRSSASAASRRLP